MGINNIGKLFYKDYYGEVDFNKLLFDELESEKKKEREKTLSINDTIKNESSLVKIDKPITGIVPRRVIVQYPGILTGVGLEHDVALKDGYKLGMHFDYTHGMPIIYGSSIKGVLKTYFEDFFLKRYPQREKDLKPLMSLIFDGKNPKFKNRKDQEPKYVSLYERDAFFDAVIVEPYNDRFLEDESITPHTEGALKNPIPIKMLKIVPGCEMEFRFKLHTNWINGNKYDSEEKLDLFMEILETVGIGAKTNVGYGQLEIKNS